MSTVAANLRSVSDVLAVREGVAAAAGVRRDPLVIAAFGSSGSAHVASRVRGFAERGHRVVLLCDVVSGIPGVEEVPVWDRPAAELPGWLRLGEALLWRLTGRSLGTIRLYFHLRHILRELRPDVLHVHYAYSVPAWLVPALDAPVVVVSIMGGDVLFEEQGSPTPRGRSLTIRLLRHADLITAKSDFLITVLDRLGGLGRKAIRVVWGVRLGHFVRGDGSAVRAALGIAKDAPVILSPKILQPFYNVHLLVEALPGILARQPDAALVLTEYGADPAYRAAIAERARELGVAGSLRFAGHVPHGEMPRYYSIADVSVAVPSSDGLPQTLLEGMACGVPNVLSRLPRYQELVSDGESAVFVDADPASIASAVTSLLADPAKRARIARKGREIVEREADFDHEVGRVESAMYALRARVRRKPGVLSRLWTVLQVRLYSS